MQNNVLIRLTVLLWLWAPVALATPDIQRWTDASGAEVYYLETQGLPLLDIGLIFDAGSARDADQAGLAALTNAMLDQGAAGKSADAIAQTLEGVGAQLSTDVDRDSATISLRSLTDPEILTPALQVFVDVVTRPDFPKADFERQRKQTLLGIQARQESPGTLAQLAFFKQIFGTHPYANAITGYADSIQALSRKDLQRFHQQYYVARNAVLIIVGAVSPDQAKAIAKQLLAGLPQGEAAKPLPVVEAPDQAQLEQIAFPSEQTHIYSGLPGMTVQDPDYFPLMVGNHILGGSGFTSRIVKEIREARGLSYSAYSYFSPMAQAGPFMMGLQTRNEKAEEALNALHETLVTFVHDGPTDAELEASKKNITGGFALRLDSNRKLFGQIGHIAFYKLPLDYLAQYIDRVNAVTREQIQDAFQRRVNPDRLATAQVGRLP